MAHSWWHGLTTRKVAQAAAPPLGLLIAINEFLIRSGEPRPWAIIAAFGFLGLPFPLAADEKRKGEGS